MDNAIEIQSLTKSFGSLRALDELNANVEKGSVYGLVGPNGAGKTTMFAILMGLIRADYGKALIHGLSFRNASEKERSRVVFVSQDQRSYPSLTIKELCRYISGFYTSWDKQLAEDLVARFELKEDVPVGYFSGGEQRRVSILLALATRAEVILMDEPAANLDPLARRSLIEELASALAEREGVTVLFSTHILSDLERVADTIGLVDRGKMRHESKIEDVTSNARKIQVIFEGGEVPAGFQLPGEFGNRTVEGPVLTGLGKFESDSEIEQFSNQPGMRVNLFPLDLEDVFVEMMKK